MKRKLMALLLALTLALGGLTGCGGEGEGGDGVAPSGENGGEEEEDD